MPNLEWILVLRFINKTPEVSVTKDISNRAIISRMVCNTLIQVGEDFSTPIQANPPH